MSTSAPAGEMRGYCRECGKPLTAETVREVRGVLYCEDCLAARVTGAPAAKVQSGAPALAAILGIVPGLGAVYNGEYVKALVHVLIFGGIVATLASDPPEPILALCIVMLIGFVLYMPIEAYRTARAKIEGKSPRGVLSEGSDKPIGPIILIGLGILFLLSKFDFFDIGLIFEYGWPVILIGIGGWMMWKRTQGNR